MTEEDQKKLSFRQLIMLAEKKGDFCLLDYFPNVMVSFCFEGSEVGIPLKKILKKYSEFCQEALLRVPAILFGEYRIFDLFWPGKELKKWISNQVREEQEAMAEEQEWRSTLIKFMIEQLPPEPLFAPMALLTSNTPPLVARDYLADFTSTVPSPLPISNFIIPVARKA